MKWFWKVRIYTPNGQYAYTEIITDRDLQQINAIQNAYEQLTSCKMLLEEMSTTPFNLKDGFNIVWGEK